MLYCLFQVLLVHRVLSGQGNYRDYWHERRSDSHIMIICNRCLLLQVVSSPLSSEAANIFSIRSGNRTIQQRYIIRN